MSRVHRTRLMAFLAALTVVLFALGWDPGGAVSSLGEVLTGNHPVTPVSGTSEGDSGEDRQGGFRRRNPFRIVRVHPPPAPPPTAPASPALATRPPPPTPAEKQPLPLRLLGTIAGDPLGVAFLRHLKDGEEIMLPLGGNLGTALEKNWLGVVLTKVGREKVLFERGAESWTLHLNGKTEDEGEGETVVAAPTSAPEALAPASSEAPVTQRVVSRGDVEANLKNLGFLITQLNVQPFFQNGQPSGFRISRIRPGSFVDKMGARNGDVIRAVNGKEIRLIKDAFLLYNSFKTDPSVQVELLRDGKLTRLGYQIR